MRVEIHYEGKKSGKLTINQGELVGLLRLPEQGEIITIKDTDFVVVSIAWDVETKSINTPRNNLVAKLICKQHQ